MKKGIMANIHLLIQIIENSQNPLELLREAISNAYDCGSSEIEITVEYIKETGKINIILKDNGHGIHKEDIERLIFNVGYSTKPDSHDNIGKKGVGTALYLKCECIKVTSFVDGKGAYQIWENPYRNLLDARGNTEISDIGIERPQSIECNDIKNGTIIEIQGYFNNDVIIFHHDNLKDYIRWFTKAGSFERFLGKGKNFTVKLKGLSEFKEHRDECYYDMIKTSYDTFVYKDEIRTSEHFDIIESGLDFPLDISEVDTKSIVDKYLFSKKIEESNKEALKKLIKQDIWVRYTSDDEGVNDSLEFDYKDCLGNIKRAKIEFVIFRIGDSARREYNNMLKRQKNDLPSYKYIAAQRYGAYAAVDYFPVVNIDNEMPNVGGGGNGKVQFLAFFNCQNLDLTLDRTSISNIHSDLVNKFYKKVGKIFEDFDKISTTKIDLLCDSIIEQINECSKKNQDSEKDKVSQDNKNEEGDGHKLEQIEKHNDCGNKSCNRNNKIKNMLTMLRFNRVKNKKKMILDKRVIYEPSFEIEVYGILSKLIGIDSQLFDFEILDYEPKDGLDIWAKDKDIDDDNLQEDDIYEIELKYKLKTIMDHPLQNTKYIICWEIDGSLRRRMVLIDENKEKYKLQKTREGYEVVSQEGLGNRIKVIELREFIEKTFNTKFE